MGIFEERLERAQPSLWLARGQFLTPPLGRRAISRAAHFKRNRNPAKASTALIITVNRQHDPAVKQAAPEVAEPGSETVPVGVKAVLGGIQFTHGS